MSSRIVTLHSLNLNLDLYFDVHFDLFILKCWFSDHCMELSNKSKFRFPPFCPRSVPDINFSIHDILCTK